MTNPAPRRVTVVGASAAGCRLALMTQEAGHVVTLVDEHPQSLGQMAMDAPYFYGAALPTALANQNAIAQAVLDSNPQIAACFEAGVDVRIGTVAWGAFQNGPNSRHIGNPKVGVVTTEGNELIEHDALVLATGMRDFVPSFQGSDLPGVFGVKAGVAFLDIYQCYEAKRTLILGTSSSAVDFAKRASARGVQIAGMVEPGQTVAAGPAAAAEITELGIPVYFGSVVLAAEGTLSVTRVRLQAVDGADIVTVDCDSICAAIGVLPNVELPAAMGCSMVFDAGVGSWLPETNAAGQTSLEGVFWLSKLTSPERILPNILDAIGGLEKHAATIAPAPLAIAQGSYLRSWIEALHDKGGDAVLLCKCETVSRAAFLDLEPPDYVGGGSRHRHSPVSGSKHDPLIHQDQLKRLTRVGMGHCQGKRCRDEAALLLSRHFGIGMEKIRPGSYRFPVRPVDLALISAEDDTYDADEKWSYWLHEPEIS